MPLKCVGICTLARLFIIRYNMQPLNAVRLSNKVYMLNNVRITGSLRTKVNIKTNYFYLIYY